MDMDRFMKPDRRYVAVTTNCLTGEAEYFEKGRCSNIIQAIRASSTMPYISPMVMIDNTPHLDGGCSCKIPYKWAIDQGYEKIMVIKTRESSFRKKSKKVSRIEKDVEKLGELYNLGRRDCISNLELIRSYFGME